jgi:nucleoside-diphosphate-sugar epimerase
MKKIIITGAGGLVGMNLLSEIDNSKYIVIAIDKNKYNLNIAKKLFPKIKTRCADLSKKGKWKDYFKNAFCVIQLHAQISSPKKEDYFKNNVESVRNVTDVCKKYKIKKLIHISSSVVISKSKDIYVKTKKQGEDIVKKSKLNYTILRPPIMYGYFNTKHFSFIIKKFKNSPFVLVPGKGDYIRQPLYVKDLVKIIIKLIEKKPKNKTYNIIGKEKIYFPIIL